MTHTAWSVLVGRGEEPTHVELYYSGGASVLASVETYCRMPDELSRWTRARLLTRRMAIAWMARRRGAVRS